MRKFNDAFRDASLVALMSLFTGAVFHYLFLWVLEKIITTEVNSSGDDISGLVLGFFIAAAFSYVVAIGLIIILGVTMWLLGKLRKISHIGATVALASFLLCIYIVIAINQALAFGTLISVIAFTTAYLLAAMAVNMYYSSRKSRKHKKIT